MERAWLVIVCNLSFQFSLEIEIDAQVTQSIRGIYTVQYSGRVNEPLNFDISARARESYHVSGTLAQQLSSDSTNAHLF